MNRLDKALHLVNREGFGLEIGPSLDPIVPKKKGFNVETVDHATAEELRKKYRDLPDRIVNIEEVDYVWQGEPLTELIGKQGIYDYIIASHVIEHVPDFVSFLIQCEMLLKPDGVLSLIVPDKRYCFDYFRWPSSTGDVLQAYTDKRVRHSPGAVFDHFSNMVRMDGFHVWAEETKIGKFSFINSMEDARQLWKLAQINDDYIDIHSWRFTPLSFKLILHDLNMLELTQLSEKCRFATTGCEFYVTLGKSAASKPKVDRLQLATEAVNELLKSLGTKEKTLGEKGGVRGVVDQVSSELIHGWCMRLDTTVPVILALYINNEQIAITEASLPRPDVHEEGIHPTGFCGFQFVPQNQFLLRVGDIVRVKSIDTNYPVDLINSPMTIQSFRHCQTIAQF